MRLRTVAQLRRFWAAYVEALKRHLDRTEQQAPTKKKLGRE
jgi:hypothetical protein